MKIDIARTCLLVIDIQNDGCGVGKDNSGRYAPIVRAVGKIENFTDNLKARGLKHAVYTKHIGDRGLVPANTRNLFDRKTHLDYDDYLKNTNGSDLYHLKPTKNDLVITKHTWSAFGNPELQQYLSDNKIENLIICGIYTQVCVLSTITSAYEKGYNIYVPKECVATKLDKITTFHEPVMAIIERYFGFIVTEEELIERLDN